MCYYQSMDRKGFSSLIVIGIIVVVIIVGAIGYFAWRQSSQTSEVSPVSVATDGMFQWRAAGITFQYPNGWNGLS